MTKTNLDILPDLIGMIQAASHAPTLTLAGLSGIGRPALSATRPAAGRILLGGLLCIGPGPGDTIH